MSRFDRVMFPVGGFSKTQVRAIANLEAGLPRAIHERKTSTGLCYVGNGRFRKWLGEYLAPNPGRIMEIGTDNVIGRHEGLSFYTIGQCTKLQGRPHKWYVVRKDPEQNILLVGRWDCH